MGLEDILDILAELTKRVFSRKDLAEREGFEPPIPVKVCPLSRRIVSTAHAPLRAGRLFSCGVLRVTGALKTSPAALRLGSGLSLASLGFG